MSEIRRNLLIGQKVAQKDYVKDGLMLYLDCLNTANCSNNQWVDSISGITFTGKSTYSERGFYFNGSDTYLRTPTDRSLFNRLPNPFCCTIETVFERMDFTKWGMVFADGDWDGKLLEVAVDPNNDTLTTWAYLPNSYTDASHNAGRFLLQRLTYNTISESYSGQNANLKIGYCNKQELDSRYGYDPYITNATHRGNSMIIGARIGSSYSQSVPSGSGFFTGYIKAIRYYNRPLTTEEILNNQQIDIERYNLPIS